MRGFNYADYDGLGLAELVKKKEVRPIELVEAAIERIEALNPQFNAVIHKMYDQARAQAETLPDGPFAGVPMLLKNITQEIKGEPTTFGSKALAGYRAKEDSHYVKKLREAGAVFLGITNTPEFGLVAVTEPAHYGPTRNPWNPDYTPGGSSGGSAAAVASGMVPIAGANDGGGSIRIPAAYCGLFGLKPTRGRTPVGPRVGRQWQGAAVEHVLTRSVRDSAAMLDVLKTYEKTAAYHAPVYEGSYLELSQTPPKKRFRIAFSLQSPLGTEVEPECREAVLKTAKLLESMGHAVEEKEAPVNGRKIAAAYMSLYFGEVSATLDELEEAIGRKARHDDVEPTTWFLGQLGKAVSAKDFVLGLREWDKAAHQMETFHETYDFYLTPTTAYKQAKIGELGLSRAEQFSLHVARVLHLARWLQRLGIVDRLVEKNLMRTPFTQLANLTGQPAMSVPLHLTESGLPVGVQFMAAKGREDLLLQLAGELEKTDHWVDIRKNKRLFG